MWRNWWYWIPLNANRRESACNRHVSILRWRYNTAGQNQAILSYSNTYSLSRQVQRPFLSNIDAVLKMPHLYFFRSNSENTSEAILLWGDAAGFVTALHFTSANISLFERPSAPAGEKQGLLLIRRIYLLSLLDYSFIHYGDLYSAPSRLLLSNQKSAPDPCTAKKKSFETRVECVRKNPGEQSLRQWKPIPHRGTNHRECTGLGCGWTSKRNKE